MASYLEAYGAGEQKRARRLKLWKWSVSLAVVLAIVGFILYSVLQNRSEERRIQAFVDLLKAKDYQGAYRMWGCTEATPCRDYSLQRFMDDWGPASEHADAANAQVGSGDSCGTGVVVPVDFKKGEAVPLWVERANKTIGFSPDPECRKRRWHFKEFFRSFFNKSSFLQFND